MILVLGSEKEYVVILSHGLALQLQSKGNVII